jgi:uncharacterized delta-60 repeat protein
VVAEGYIESAGVQVDGKVLAAGRRNGENVVVLKRLDTSGQLDPAFGRSGETVLPLESVDSVLPEPDGRILVIGSNNGRVLVRLNTDGTVDATYGQAGVARLNVPGGFQGSAFQPDGKLVLGLHVSQGTGTLGRPLDQTNGTPRLVRTSATGSIDGSF